MRYLWRSPRRVMVLASELLVSPVSFFLSFLIRFDGYPHGEYFRMFLQALPLVFMVRLGCFWFFGLYRGIWNYASVTDLLAIVKAVSAGTVAIVLGALFIYGHGFPRSVFIIDWLLMVTVLGGERFLIRVGHNWQLLARKKMLGRRILIIGAGDTGEMILREILNNAKLNFNPVGFIDDDPKKQGFSIHRVPVLGKVDDLFSVVQEHDVEEAFIAIPIISGDKMRQIVDVCAKTKIGYKTVPALADLVNGTVSINDLREVKIEDLLGREPVELDREKTQAYLVGKTILVSGAGGSIGAEICRQALKYRPRLLILVERSESGLFYLEMELKKNFPELRIKAVLADICDQLRMKEIFAEYRPQMVFHCAAYKHVPIIEENPSEAIKNNIWGTKVIARRAIDYGVEDFVMLSTDKAVEPVNFMGVSKRVTELYLNALNKKSATRFMTVRFGNVLDSEGSVVPIFKRQIREDRRITVTHPEVRRYFMSIPEAVSLVLEAGCLGQGGEIFVLEMGQPVKIVDLARGLIKLSGLEPDKDVQITFGGLRVGEKLHEALFNGQEELIPTKNKKIFLINTKNCLLPEDEDVRELKLLADNADLAGLTRKLELLVPEFQPCEKKTEPYQPVMKIFSDNDVLVVDDDESVRRLLRKYLEGKGHTVWEAENGKKALKVIAETKKIKLVFLDILMPGSWDGLDTLQKIKEHNRHIEVVMITGHPSKKAWLKGEAFGAYDQINKPLLLEDIRQITEAVLARKMSSEAKSSLV